RQTRRQLHRALLHADRSDRAQRGQRRQDRAERPRRQRHEPGQIHTDAVREHLHPQTWHPRQARHGQRSGLHQHLHRRLQRRAGHQRELHLGDQAESRRSPRSGHRGDHRDQHRASNRHGRKRRELRGGMRPGQPGPRSSYPIAPPSGSAEVRQSWGEIGIGPGPTAWAIQSSSRCRPGQGAVTRHAAGDRARTRGLANKIAGMGAIASSRQAPPGGSRRARIAIALAGGGLMSLGAGAAASGAPASPRYRIQRLCGAPRPGAAACLAMKLVPASLTRSDLRANANRQGAESARGATPAVIEKTPIPGYLTPQRLHAAYALPSESDASSLQTVAVVDAFDDPTAEADLDVYDKQFGLPACTKANGCFRKLNQDGQTGPLPPKEGEWAGETSIDVQMAHAICQSCRVLLVEANTESFANLGTAVNAAVAAGATVVSNSYGAPERAASSTKLNAKYFDHPGVVITASSGDCGYLNTACAGLNNAAEFPAASPTVLAVGGTTLKEVKKAWTSTTWEEGGSGCSLIFSAAAWQSAAPNFSATG